MVAIVDDVHYSNTVEMIDRLMAAGKLTKGPLKVHPELLMA